MISEKIVTIEALIVYLERVCSAYRKSYKLLSSVNKAILISSGILTSTTVLVLIPAVPVFVAGVAAVPVILTIINQNLKLTEKKEKLKLQHKNYKQLLTYVRSKIFEDNPAEVVKDVFNKSLEFQKNDNYVTPMEIYIKKYQLNGYYQPALKLEE